ncbi:protein kinase C and casein kinase substrate in neurons protein 1-like isoform X3 [Watersipora subatra]|uniref:protein kinase C and casein kinase substrate in neurons protein 1-like isoform X3 n=1 Tax=Watersipora subatra TaxID=2589382 RepID=UPI00355B6D6F
MSVSQEVIPYDETGGSFWEINGFKATSKRVNDGNSLCSDLMSMIKERSEIENKYSSMLRQWSKKWYDQIGKGPEYGTTEGAFGGLFQECDRLSNLHSRIRDLLSNEVYQKVKQWQKETYTKQKLGGLKQFKEMDDGFTKAQKPWAKKYEKVVKTRDEFHKACKNLRTAEINERNQQGDTSISEDQKRKNILKIEEWENKRDLSRNKYEVALQDITDYNARYMEDMTEVFMKCQALEENRQEFFKRVLFDVQQCLNLSTDPEYSQIYADLHQTISNADSDKDLTWWSQAHGIDMVMLWPTFEEFVPQQAHLSKKGVKGRPVGEEGITLTMLRKEEPPMPTAQSYQNDRNQPNDNRNTYNGRSASYYEPSLNPFGDADTREDFSDNECIDSGSGLWFHADPAGGDEGDQSFLDGEDDYLVDDGRPGVPIRALYDYEGSEDDELSFKAGDEFEKLEDEDEQGWCKGRLHNRVGLYPANYCVEI